MSLKTSDIRFKERIRIQIQDPIMRKAVANAQERIGTNRQKMVDELGHWEEWRSRAELNRPGFPGECFICELRLPDHRFRWKH
ncbi:hypothetical protein NQF40_21065, partial [Escherichia coli]|nr:hypothetical protein [Escherichia coli]MDR6076990.1 hypothetical protein [Escherichia coli]